MARKVNTADVEELNLLQGENEELKASLQVMTEKYHHADSICEGLYKQYNDGVNEITELNKHLGFYQNRNLWQRIINKKYS